MKDEIELVLFLMFIGAIAAFCICVAGTVLIRMLPYIPIEFLMAPVVGAIIGLIVAIVLILKGRV